MNEESKNSLTFFCSVFDFDPSKHLRGAIANFFRKMPGNCKDAVQLCLEAFACGFFSFTQQHLETRGRLRYYLGISQNISFTLYALPTRPAILFGLFHRWASLTRDLTS